jgi:putative ubiquitin-RnfH superfamily antitoxin RatB of RatAB toxin-antitoxin module
MDTVYRKNGKSGKSIRLSSFKKEHALWRVSCLGRLAFAKPLYKVRAIKNGERIEIYRKILEICFII